MNKTYLFEPIAPYTAGGMLVVADSLQEIKDRIVDFLKKYNKVWRIPEQEGLLCQEYPMFEKLNTGLKYDKDGNSRCLDIAIFDKEYKDDDPDGWYLITKFNSDLPKGIHYLEDYCS